MADAHVLVVEDDEAVRLTTSLVLERQGFAVSAAADGVEALAMLAEKKFDIAVVDVVMPRMDGITFVRRARERFPLPVIMLTARDLPHDQLAGFDAGADDYVIKPFDGAVLAARIRAVLRRGADTSAAATTRLGDLEIDIPGMTLTRDGVPVTLSGTEFRLLAVLFERQGRVLSKTQLLELVWGDAGWGDEHIVEVNVARLRSKIGADHLKTVRGLGYKLVSA